MAHEIETNFYVGRTPWHGLGVYVGEEEIFSKEAILASGLNWTVRIEKLFTSMDGINPIEVESHKAVIRESDFSVLGVVGNVYAPIQNLNCFQLLDSLVEDKLMRYHTAGSLRNGKAIWLLGKIGSTEVVPNDKLDHFIMLYNTHDGTRSLRCFFTTVRVVCANTANMALSGARGEGLTIRHTTNIQEKIIQAKHVLNIGTQLSSEYTEAMKHLASTQISVQDWNNFLEYLIPEPEEASEKLKTIREKTRRELTRLFEEGTGQDIPNVSGTKWAAYNAVTEFSNYFLRANGINQQAKRFEGLFFGSGARMTRKATEYLLAAA